MRLLEALLLVAFSFSLSWVVYTLTEPMGITFFESTSSIEPREEKINPSRSRPPEDTTTMLFCAEKCKYVPAMCDGIYEDTMGLPAPRCMLYSTTLKGDRYWSGRGSVSPHLNDEAYALRNNMTRDLVVWGAQQISSTGGCEQLPFAYTHPMMWPGEFEFIVKTLINARPRSYLEWGSGKSTSFYPLLVSESVRVIDGYPPWCEKVKEDPTVGCMVDQGRLRFICKEPVRPDGSVIQLLEEGRLPPNIDQSDAEIVARGYVNSVDELDIDQYDAALVDGRYRVACALKLLHRLGPDSVLFMHDFWIREKYHAVLDYYDVIGYARSAVALRKKNILPQGWEDVYLSHLEADNMIR